MKNNERKTEVSNTAKVQALFSQFPWLSKRFNAKALDRVVVRTVDAELLEHDCGYQPFCSDLFFGDRVAYLERSILILNKDGKELGIVGHKIKIIPARTGRMFLGIIPLKYLPEKEEEDVFQETIGEALIRLDIEKAHYIVSTMKDGESVRLIFCTPGENRTLVEVLKKEQEVAHAHIKKELAAVVSS